MNLTDFKKEKATVNEVQFYRDNVLPQLITDDKGRVKNKMQNYITFIDKHTNFAGKIKYNDFSQVVEFDGLPISDNDVNEVIRSIDNCMDFRNNGLVEDSILAVALDHRYHPLKDYFKSLKWDGTERLERFWIDLLEADDTELNRTMTKLWFIATVKRIFDPGCQFDNMIILQGEQGIGKTTSLTHLLPRGYVTELKQKLNEVKDLVHILNRSAIVFIDELDKFKKAEISEIKSFVSASEDTVRLSYAKHAQTYFRHCTLAGSCNDTSILKDTDSIVERRFWIIKCNKKTRDDKINRTMTQEFVDQLWAEACHYYTENPKLYLDIPLELQDDFEKTMDQFKCWNNDIDLDNINMILNKTYLLDEEGHFKNQEDFYNQVVHSQDSATIEFFGEDDKGFSYKQLDEIPGNYLKYVITKIYGKDSWRSLQYICNASSGEFELKAKKLNGVTTRMIIRVKNEEDKNI